MLYSSIPAWLPMDPAALAEARARADFCPCCRRSCCGCCAPAVLPQPVAGAWSTALCDCCAQPGGCRRSLYTCACHACAFGDLALAAPAQAFPFAGPGGWAKACVAFPCFPLLGCMARSGLRREYTLAGDPMLDLWVSMYCSCCATCQAYREVLIRRAAAEAALWHRGEVGLLPQGSFPVQGVPATFVASAQAETYSPPSVQEALKL